MKSASLVTTTKAVLKPFYAQVFWPNAFFKKDLNAIESMPLREEIEGIGYFLQKTIGGPHHVWGDINGSDLSLSHFFGGGGYRYLMKRQNTQQDWFWGLYTFYFYHAGLLADHWDIGIECGSIRSAQLTCDFHQFLHPKLEGENNNLTDAVLDKYAASCKLTFSLLPSSKCFAGANIAWVQERGKEKLAQKDTLFAGVEWMLNPFVIAEFQTIVDVKTFQPVGRLNFRLQASGLTHNLSEAQNCLKRPPQRNNPLRYSKYIAKTENTKPILFTDDRSKEDTQADKKPEEKGPSHAEYSTKESPIDKKPDNAQPFEDKKQPYQASIEEVSDGDRQYPQYIHHGKDAVDRGKLNETVEANKEGLPYKGFSIKDSENPNNPNRGYVIMKDTKGNQETILCEIVEADDLPKEQKHKRNSIPNAQRKVYL